jgi:hypothetical protein
MRRIALTIGVASALALGAPAVASAHRHHHRHHHARVRVEGFGAISGVPNMAPGSTAGTVTSFENGVLTITLNDGSIVKGAVKEQTEIRCASSEPAAHASDHGEGSQNGAGDEGQQGNDREEAMESENGQENENEDQPSPSACGPASLVHGALVQAAELQITPAGAVFEEVELAG